LIVLVFVLHLPGTAAAKFRDKKPGPPPEGLQTYIDKAKVMLPPSATTTGSLWVDQGSFAQLATDYKAAKLGDVVTINVIEDTSASASGTVKAQRSFQANSGISGFFGHLGPTSGLQTLYDVNSKRALNGQGQTASSSTLTTNLTGTVVAVLPNGYLVVQAVRILKFDNQRQHVTVRGIVRPGDLQPDNSVSSTAVADLEVDIEGKGVISDSVRQPNVVVRTLMKILEF
jgi:flagellar L-ring protein precursor FlgH